MPKPKWLGDLEEFQVAAPAAGVNVDIQPPAGTIWKVEGIYVAFTAAVAVADRRFAIIQRGGTQDKAHVFCGVAFVALSTATVVASSRFQGVPYNTIGFVLFPLGEFCYITNTIYMRVMADGIQAADQFGICYINAYRMLEE